MRLREIVIACWLGSLFVITPTPIHAAFVAQKVDRQAAQQLAAQGYSWPLIYMEYDRREKFFYLFAALGGQYATAPVGWITVNPWTGDVWDVWSCNKLSTATLRKSQAAIRRKFQRDELRQYSRLRALKPICHGP
jgi:hypothetical protein